MANRRRWITTVSLAAFILAGCSDDSTTASDPGADPGLDAATDELRSATGTDDIELTCAEQQDSEEARSCTATVDGQQIPVAVGVDGDEEAVDIRALIVSREELETEISSQATELVGAGSQVSCGESDRIIIPDNNSVECTVSATDGTEGTAVIVAGPGGPAIVELRSDS